jgi:hypothetical protein
MDRQTAEGPKVLNIPLVRAYKPTELGFVGFDGSGLG